jgi:hypothetical protein
MKNFLLIFFFVCTIVFAWLYIIASKGLGVGDNSQHYLNEINSMIVKIDSLSSEISYKDSLILASKEREYIQVGLHHEKEKSHDKKIIDFRPLADSTHIKYFIYRTERLGSN